MKKWIARWFGGSAGSAPADALRLTPGAAFEESGPASAGANAPGAGAAAISGAAIDATFFHYLTDAIPRGANPAAERIVLDELARLAVSPSAGADLVPRVPAVIPQLLRSLRDDSLSGGELSRQLAQDVVLVAEVIREANSPYYHPAIPVKSVETAVRLLGQNGLRMLLARVAFRPIISMQTGRHARQVAPLLWAQSELCASAARLLAPAMGANPFEAYLAGLMNNVGLIVAFRLMDQIWTDGPLPDSEAFRIQVQANARILSGRIGEGWDFPATVTAAIAGAGNGAISTAPLLARTLMLSERSARLRQLTDAGRIKEDEVALVEGMHGAALACFAALRSEDA